MSRIVKSAVLIASLAAVAATSGCGSSAKVEANTTSVGQQLQDLDAARNKGLITEQEYQSKRKEIMKSK